MTIKFRIKDGKFSSVLKKDYFFYSKSLIWEMSTEKDYI